MKRLLIQLSLFALIITSCELYEQDEYREKYFVESYLVEGEPLPRIRLTTTASFDTEYIPSENYVTGANVLVHLLDDNDERVATYVYREPSNIGVYVTYRNEVIVQSERTYELEITFPDSDDTISARTTVPGEFELLSSGKDTLLYQSSEQFTATYSASYYPGRQSYYIFATRALDPENYSLTPFWKMADNEQSSLTLINSGIINEDNYQVDDQELILRFPWLGIAYYGPNEIITYAIDDNIYDFYRSQSVQLGGSTLSPGEIPNIIYNIEGGIGLFGSMAGAKVRVFVDEP
ncbi:MAG: DUF4249 family protein [Balneolales bacterium]